MNDTVKHSDDEAIVSLTYTWGMVGGFLLEHGRPATDRNIEALVAACGFGRPHRERHGQPVQRRIRRG